MIPDPQQLSLDVEVDESVADSNISVSLGLIVTELVINALKHAFPAGGEGHIAVGYLIEPAGWMMTVGDDGVGLPADALNAKAGLGTSIVQGLAKQLGATFSYADATPGLTVSLQSARQ
jgi:two-component sensor histidine kinase